MKTVKQAAELAGVSVRTLHHYDAIGLLKPSRVTDAGYRLYDDEALRRLQSILLYRRLQFSLEEIKDILDSPVYDPREALAQQIDLLERQREQLDGIIALARRMQKGGDVDLDFEPLKEDIMQQYKEEAKARWGGTAQWSEYEERQRRGNDPAKAAEGLMELFARFGALRGGAPDSAEARALVEELKDYISANFYTCTDEILASLGQMYTADERFAANIDKAGGAGTADFAARAIAAYCGK